MTYISIRILSMLGLATDVKLPRVTKVDAETATIAKPKAVSVKKSQRRDEEQELVGASID